MQVFFHDFFLGIGDMQEAFVKGVDIVAVKFVAYLFKADKRDAGGWRGCRSRSDADDYNIGRNDDAALLSAEVFSESLNKRIGIR